jgi:hypothetical protein
VKLFMGGFDRTAFKKVFEKTAQQGRGHGMAGQHPAEQNTASPTAPTASSPVRAPDPLAAAGSAVGLVQVIAGDPVMPV